MTCTEPSTNFDKQDTSFILHALLAEEKEEIEVLEQEVQEAQIEHEV